MGYNGGINKRGYYRRYHGMYSKSSCRFGDKLFSGLILGSLRLISTAASSTSNPKGTSTRKRKAIFEHDAYTPAPKPLSIEDSLINRMDSEQFSQLKDDYNTVVLNNRLISHQIGKLRNQIKQNSFLRLLFYLIPKYRSIFEDKITSINSSIIQKEQELEDPIINVNSLLNNDLPNITLVNRGKIIMAFYDVNSESYINEYKTLNVSEVYESNFNYNYPAIGIFKSKIIQLHLFHKGLIAIGKGAFGIIDYHDITAHYTTINIKTRYIENGLKVVRKTWLHANTNESPDLRYNENYEIYLVEYGCLKLNLRDNLIINLLFSDASYGKEVANLFNLTPNKETTTPKVDSLMVKEDIAISDTCKVYTTTYNKAILTQTEKELCDAIRRYGKPLNTRIAYKCPQIGSSVKRRSDGAILEVINISIDHKFKCYDFAKDECYIYTREELMLS